ncbi:secreted RxLR effector protein 161-like [Physcomitrium patens]|uniref:secreted RxLR effector protein 161-like n=1 Tax=Physcomitrium patens TaxID=3218 RepID=UPI003CCCD595
MTELGEATMYLGAELKQNNSGIWFDQENYINKLLHRFDMINCNPARTPMSSSLHLQADMNQPLIEETNYRSLIGGLLYTSMISRPDICFAENTLSRYTQHPQVAHLTAAKRVLRYLKGTANSGIFYPYDNYLTLVSYADADYGRDIDTRRPISGLIHKLGKSPIEWSSKRQATVALSTTEAEYRVLSEAAKDAIHLRQQRTLKLLNCAPLKPITCDLHSSHDA